LHGAEIPYYTMVLGAGVLKLHSLGLVPAASPPLSLPQVQPATA
jgi:hypothetical protein